MKLYMQKAAKDLIGNVGFDMQMNSIASGPEDDVITALEDLFDGVWGDALDPTFMFNPLKRGIREKAKRAGALMRKIGHTAVRNRLGKMRRGEETSTDLLAHSISIKENNTWYTEEEIVDDFVTFFVAGQETTTNVLSFTLAHLARHPDIARRVGEEVEAALEGRDYVGEEALSRLPYLECVIKESLRLHPPGSIIRRMTPRDTLLDGFLVPADTIVLTIPYLQARMEENWEEPLIFNPDRFLDPSTIKKYSYLPFLVGPRRCIGTNFAMIEMKIILSRVISRFSMRGREGEGIVPGFKMTLYPEQGAHLHLQPKY